MINACFRMEENNLNSSIDVLSKIRDRVSFFNFEASYIRTNIVRLNKPHMRANSILMTLVILFWFPAFSQNEHKIWYFGTFAGLDFNTTPPAILANSGMMTS